MALSPHVSDIGTPSSPRRIEIHVRTRKEVASVVMRQKSRKTRATLSAEVKTSSVITDDTQRFSQLFGSCITCLKDMEKESSPLEKVVDHYKLG